MANGNNLITLSVDLDTSQADAELLKWRLKQHNNPVIVPIKADTSQLQSDINNILKNINVNIDLSANSVRQQIGNINNIIKTGITPAPVDVPFQFDISDSTKVKAEVEKLVNQVTGNKGQLVRWKIGFDYDNNADKVLIKYKNELGEVTDASIKLKSVGKIFDAQGNAHEIVQWSSGLKSISQNVEAVVKANQREIATNDAVIRKRAELIAQMKVLTAQSEKAGISLNKDNIDNFNNLSVNASTVEDIKQLEHYLRIAKTELSELNAQISKGTHATSLESMNQNLSDMPNKLALIESKFQGLKMPENARIQIEALRQGLDEINNTTDPVEKIKKYNQLVDSLKNLEREYQIYSQETKNFSNEMSAIQGGKVLSNNIVTWMSENREAAVKYSDALEKIVAESQNITNKTDLRRLQEQFRVIRTEAEATEKSSTNFFQMLKNSMGDALENMLKYSLAYQIINKTTQAIREMADTVSELDRTLVEMNKVADLSESQLEDFLEQTYRISSEIGKSGRSMIEASTEFVRAGYTVEESLDLGKAALITTNVGDKIESTADAAGTLIAVLKGFKMSDTDVMDVVDKLNQVSNNAPVGFDNLANGLERTSGALSTMGNNLDQSIGMLTAGYGQLRNMEKVSTGLITISARLRGVDEDGESIDGLKAELEDAFGSVGVSITDANGELRSTFDILQDYASIYDTLSTKQQQWLNELAAGKRQITVLDAIVDNWKDVENAVYQAENATGSATRENEIYKNSIEGLKNELANAKEQLSTEVFESEWIKSGISALTSFLKALTNILEQEGLISSVITNTASGLEIISNILERISENDAMARILQLLLTYKTISTGVGLLGNVKNFIGSFNTVGSHIEGWITGAGKASATIEELGEASALSAGEVKSLSTAVEGVGSAVSLGTLTGVLALVVGIGSALESRRQNNLLKEVENVTKTYEQSKQRLTENRELYNELSEQYVELSKGVDDLGYNISLTDDEYERYQSVVSQLVDINPSLLQGYNEQNTAILTIKDSVDALTESYKRNIVEANNSIIRSKESIGQRYAENLNSYGDLDIQNDYDKFMASKAINELLTLSTISEESVQTLLNEYSGNIKTLLLEAVKEAGYDRKSFETDANLIARVIAENQGRLTLQTISADYKAVVDEYVNGMLDYSEAYIENQLINSNIPEELRQIILNQVGGFDADFFNQFINEDNTYDFTSLNSELLNLVDTYQSLQDKHPELIELGIGLITSFNNQEITVGEYLEKVNEINQIISEFPEDVQKNVRLLFGIDENSKVNNQIEHLKDLLGDNFSEEAISDLTAQQLNMIATVEIEDKPYTVDQLKDKIENKINPIEVELSYESDQTKALDSLDTAFSDDLETVYSAGQNNETVSASELQSLNDAFGGTTFNSSEDIDKINSLSTAIEAYNQVLSQTDVKAEDAQIATDKLITAYIDQSNILDSLINNLDDVTEEQKNYVKEQLKAQGVTNADEVVESRLTKAYQKASSALKEVATTLTKYNKVIKAGDDSAEDYTTAMDSIIDSTRRMIGVYDEAGNFSDELTPKLNDKFITDNLDKIERATEGDVSAIRELRAEAAKQIQIDIDLNDEAVYQAHNDLIDLVAGLDASSFSIDGFMDNSAAYSAMAALISQAGYTASQVKSIISAASGGTITAEVGYDYITTDVPDVTLPKEAYGGASSKVTYTATKVKVPKFKFKYNESASSTGAGASYGGGGGSSSSGGSGGSGGGGSSDSSDNKKTEDDEETYDWIEVYIQRLEEELDRLEEVVDSTYTSWSKRNNTLKKELKNLNSQMEANNTAYDNYLSKANSIQVNDGKTTVDDDDYGDNDTEQKTYDQSQLDKAIAEWNTGKYQKLIQAGKLGTDAIEKIQNTYLQSAISSYREWYDKAVEAKDKATSLAETIKSKYEQMFSNVKDAYEDMIDILSKKTDLIGKRISRMENSGYFVDKRLYTLEKNSTQKELDKQRKETDELIKKRNDAIKKGKIKVGSESDSKMQQDILDSLAKEADYLETLREIERKIRQEAWDRFDWLQEQLETINEEAEHFDSILSHFKQVDDKGNFTNEGLATLAAYTAQYEQNKKELEDYQTEYQKVQADLANDKNNQDLIDRADTLRKKILELEEENWQLAEDAKSKWQEAFEAHLSNLQTIISEYKDALSSAKDLYTYQNNVEKQAKNIAKLEKQMAAYRGDTSEEARKKQIELQQQYEAAQEQLQETEWDKYISDTEELLDRMYEDYEDYLNSKLDDITQIMGLTNSLLESNKQAVNDGFAKVTSTWDGNNLNLPSAFDDTNLKSTITSELGKVIDALKNIKLDVTNVDNNANGSTSKITSKERELTGETTDTASTQTVANSKEEEKEREKQAKKKAEEAKIEAEKQKAAEKAKNKTWVNGVYWENGKQKYTGGKWEKDAKGSWYSYGNGQYLKNAWHTIDGVKYHFDKNGYVDQVQGSMIDNSASIKTKKLKNQKVTGTLTQLATGIKRVTRPDIYETNEADTGSELIYKTQSGGILTPLDAGDMVFSHAQAEMLYEFSKNNLPQQHLFGNKNVAKYVENNKRQTNNVEIKIDKVIANDPMEFAERLRTTIASDSQTDALIKQITIGEIAGNNTLRKNKYK